MQNIPALAERVKKRSIKFKMSDYLFLIGVHSQNRTRKCNLLLIFNYNSYNSIIRALLHYSARASCPLSLSHTSEFRTARIPNQNEHSHWIRNVYVAGSQYTSGLFATKQYAHGFLCGKAFKRIIGNCVLCFETFWICRDCIILWANKYFQ